MRDTIKLSVIGVILALVVVGFSLFIKFFFRGIGINTRKPTRSSRVLWDIDGLFSDLYYTN